MGTVWSKESFAECKQRQNSKNFLTAWELIELVGMGYFSKGLNHQILSMGINEVFNELILDVLKEVREDVDLSFCIFLIFAASDFPSKNLWTVSFHGFAATEIKMSASSMQIPSSLTALFFRWLCTSGYTNPPRQPFVRDFLTFPV